MQAEQKEVVVAQRKVNEINLSNKPQHEPKNKICGRHYNSNSFLLFSDPDTTYEEDMQILRVIEAYCVSSAPKNRQTIANSGRQLLIVLMQLLLYLV